MRARAKLNLYLHVLGRRADGYHALDSLVAFADVGDVLTVSPAETLQLEIAGPFAPALASERPENNLVWRAATRLAETAGVPPRARLSLEKNLPVASGIGGGSADAAAVLLLLSELWGVRMAEAEIQRLAFSLGADVPMCVKGMPLFAGGAGEDLTPAPALPPAHVVLVNDGTALATKDVFARRSGPFSETARFSQAPADARALARLLAQRRNDLEAPARSLAPSIATVIEALAAEPGCLLARMSGSGATCFGLFAERTEAKKARARLASARPRWWLAMAALSREPPATALA
jgi:4-diphosphocytidyl-2-C-methyl-D-erythritol kinase